MFQVVETFINDVSNMTIINLFNSQRVSKPVRQYQY
jgi:hypothetical protein